MTLASFYKAEPEHYSEPSWAAAVIGQSTLAFAQAGPLSLRVR